MTAAVTPARRRFALAALMSGGFAMGISLFTVGGLVPNMARDLLPQLWLSDPDAAIGSAGWVVTAFTLGAVVGAPLLAGTTGRVARKRLLLALVAVFVVANLLVTVAPTFGTVLVARFLSGVPFGVYISTAILVASTLMPSGQRGRGVGIVTVGAPLAALVGAPAATAIGQQLGWRMVFLLIAAGFVLALTAIAVAVPPQPGNPHAGLRSEAAALRLPQVWLLVAFGILGFGGMFAVITYIAPIATTVTQLPVAAVPLAQVAVGIGLTAGSLTGGWLVDRSVARVLVGFTFGTTVAIAGFAVFSHTVAGLLVFTALIGFGNAGTAAATQVRMIDIARNAQALGAALNQSALSLGHSTGAFLSGAALAAGLGYQAPALVGIAISAIGLVIVLIANALDRTSATSRSQPAAAPVVDPAGSRAAG